MQFRTTKKLIIDEQKLNVLIRLGCPDDRLLSVIKTGKFEKTGDQIIDEILECFVDRKEFKNWGGNHNPKGINNCKKRKNRGQVDHQVENQDGSQNGGQVVDKDKDKEKNKIKQKNKYSEIKKDSLMTKYQDLRESMERWLQYKQEKKESYTDVGLEDCFEKLQKLSGGDKELAMAIVKQSTSNNWSGLFQLKDNKQNQQKETTFQRNIRIMREMEEENNANESLF